MSPSAKGREDTSQGIELFAPAKINLDLRILGRRSDGFHELSTRMAPVSLGDRLQVALRPGREISFRCDDARIPAGEENLVCRAARLFADSFGLPCGLEIVLEKRLPSGAGLGGGSSDAAATLLALRSLFGRPSSLDALLPLAASLGSDVPFFLFRNPALCHGRGEIVTPEPWLGPRMGLLLFPGFPVPTPWAYHAYARNPRPGEERGLPPWGPVRNDLEPAVFEKFLWIAVAREWLQKEARAELALMSGSGSSVFGLWTDPPEPELVERARLFFGPEAWIETFSILSDGSSRNSGALLTESSHRD
ncbi:4-diphosphocytidyl-2-C-methyl-D-erythritol kinase [Methylacidimicrobium cyclopophantes]|uniref:4-diphosphocytidyl-2-C-methyl-D-erythritol kinase n=1 Tax=Methylacidimicrobium cyclopophantes TaxID=1041766 RepID=A0A5E6MF22_9BACT|nr:4-(cytidine 5'-diphospho)-2-C-methyl-D-erythritol kinase [Methylacidimicrobium cyclopophantes]VVM08087.1 4-diphosphocytidyl-2-C-methyl-D-erythritol kinase [Methylacidimicrobium cyclopophantes]